MPCCAPTQRPAPRSSISGGDTTTPLSAGYPFLPDAGYDYNDSFPSLRAALTWKMEAGQIATGEGGQIWAIPHAFENIQLFYRKDTLEKYNIAVPTSPPEMAKACEQLKAADPSITPLGVRGVRFWSSIHTAAVSIARSYGVHGFCRHGRQARHGSGFAGIDRVPQGLRGHDQEVRGSFLRQ